MNQDNENKPIIFFDGVCNLCNAVVQFVIKHDKKEIFLFCSAQSEKAKVILGENLNFTEPESIILFEEHELLKGSTAVLRIIKRLNSLFSILYIFIIIPKPVRDFIYRIIAKNRYKLFGKKDSCMMPNQELINRFID